MKSLGQDVLTFFSFDFPKLGRRLKKMDNADDKTVMLAFTFLADAVRVFVFFCVVMYFV